MNKETIEEENKLIAEFKKYLKKSEKVIKNGVWYYVIGGEFLTKEESYNQFHQWYNTQSKTIRP